MTEAYHIRQKRLTAVSPKNEKATWKMQTNALIQKAKNSQPRTAELLKTPAQQIDKQSINEKNTSSWTQNQQQTGNERFVQNGNLSIFFQVNSTFHSIIR